MDEQKSFFITFEGGEGAGKTTVINQLLNDYDTKTIVATREPGGIPLAEKIRSLILNRDHVQMHEKTEALLYAAARSQHYFEKIQPALEEGKTVFCDRFIDSSLAYQGFARGIGIKEILSINEFAVTEGMPDLTLFFDIEPRDALRRIQIDQSREINRFDVETIDFHNKVRAGYHQLLELYPDRIVKIDAAQPLSEVVAMSMTHIDRLFRSA